MRTIPQKTAMVCIRLGCEIIWNGPSKQCPECKHEGVPFMEIEQLACDALLPGTRREPRMQTTRIQ